MENRDQVYNTFVQNTKFVVRLLLQAYETGLPTNFTIEIDDSMVKKIAREETHPESIPIDELRADIVNGTIMECYQNENIFARKRKVNIVPIR